MSKRNFFIWASGGNRRIIDQLDEAIRPSEWNKFLGIGVSVCFTSIMAVISASFALRYIVKNEAGDPNWFVAIAFGLFWGGFIFFLDRTLVSSVKKTESARKNFLTMLPRMGLALIFAFIISKPVEIELFRHAFQTVEHKVAEEVTGSIGASINSLILENKRLKDEIDNFNVDDYAKVTRRRFQMADSIKDHIVQKNNLELGKIQANINQLAKDRRAELGVRSRKVLQDQLNELPPDSLRTDAEKARHAELTEKETRWREMGRPISDLIRNRKPFRDEINKHLRIADSLNALFLQVESKGDSIYRHVLIPKNQERISDNESKISELRAERDRRKGDFKGIWADLRAYDEYKKDKPDIAFAGWLIFLLLLGFEMAPILTKMAFPYSQYDKRLQYLDTQNITPNKSSKEQDKQTNDELKESLEPLLLQALGQLEAHQKEAFDKVVNGNSPDDKFLAAKDLIRKFYYTNENNNNQLWGDLTAMTQNHSSHTIKWAKRKMIDEIQRVLNSTQDQQVFDKVSKYIKRNGVDHLMSEEMTLNYRELEKLYKDLRRTKASRWLRRSEEEFTQQDGWHDDAVHHENYGLSHWFEDIGQFIARYWRLILPSIIIVAYMAFAFFSNLWPFNVNQHPLGKEFNLYRSPSMDQIEEETLYSEMYVSTHDTIQNMYEISANGVGQLGHWIQLTQGEHHGWVFDVQEDSLSILELIRAGQLHDKPSFESKVNAAKSQGDRLILLDSDGPRDSLSIGNGWLKHRWVRVARDSTKGWVFGGHTTLKNAETSESNENQIGS